MEAAHESQEARSLGSLMVLLPVVVEVVVELVGLVVLEEEGRGAGWVWVGRRWGIWILGGEVSSKGKESRLKVEDMVVVIGGCGSCW